MINQNHKSIIITCGVWGSSFLWDSVIWFLLEFFAPEWLQEVLWTTIYLLSAGWGLPLVPQTDPSDPSATHRVRSKRCSCNNQLDSECHYFCHLDIIWVNTPRWVFTHAWANLRKPYVSKQKQSFSQWGLKGNIKDMFSKSVSI